MIFEPILLVLLTLIIFYFLFVFKSRSEKCLSKFPQPRHHPIFGIIPTLLRAPRSETLSLLCSWSKDCGAVFRIWHPIGSMVVFTQSSAAEKLLSSTLNITKGLEYDYVRPWLGDGLLMSTGSKWGKQRKTLTPAFHFKILEDFMSVFNQESEKMSDILNAECVNGGTFDIQQYVTRCTLDIICETAMGKKVNAQLDRDSEYIRAIKTLGRIIIDRSFRPWLKIEILWRLTDMYPKHQKALKVLHGFTEKVIKERKEEILTEKLIAKKQLKKRSEEDDSFYFGRKKRNLAFLDLLLEVQAENGVEELSDLEIREETDTFMFEGHDTTATNVSFTLYALATYPEIQKRVHGELDLIFGDDPKREIRTEDLSEMKYLECVIKESLRLYPSVPFIQRLLTTDIVMNDGNVVPAGSSVGVLIYQLHRDPNKFPDPETFRPERFDSTNGNWNSCSRDPYAYIPFSAGPRNCIGQKFAMMEEKVMIGTLLRRFNLEATVPLDQLPLISEIVLKSEVGFPVRLTHRQK